MSTALKTRKKVSRAGKTAAEPIIPELELESFRPPAVEPEPDSQAVSVRFGWVGLGRCGSRLAETFFNLGCAKTLAVSSEPDDFRGLNLPAEQKFLMSSGRAKTGKSGTCGKRTVDQHGRDLFSRMEELFSDEVDHLMVCLGAGGPADADSATALIELVQSYARLLSFRRPRRQVGAMLVLPSARQARSKQAARNALNLAKTLTHLAEEKKISPLILADNDRIRRMEPVLRPGKSWLGVNRRAAELFDRFNQLSARPSPYTSFDPVDYQDVLGAGGCTVMGLTEMQQVADRCAVSRAVRKMLEMSLPPGEYDLRQAQAAACVVVGGRRMMAKTAGLQDAILYGFDVLAVMTGRATVHRGIYEDDCETLRIYTMISGLPAPCGRLKKLKGSPLPRGR